MDVLVGWRRPGTGFVPRFAVAELELQPRRRTLFDPNAMTLVWWMASAFHPDATLHTVTPPGRRDVELLLPVHGASADTAIGVHLYLSHTNARGQRVQSRMGTGYTTMNAVLTQEALKIPIQAEDDHLITELVLTVKSIPADHLIQLSPSTATTTTLVTSGQPCNRWVATPKPAFEMITGEYQRRQCMTYLPDTRRVPVWVWQGLPGEVTTPVEFYENALRFALWVCKVPDRAEFEADPLSHADVLGQVLGFFAWSCRYVADQIVDEAKWLDTEQFAMLRDHPSPLERSGDCEDMAREIYLAYYWLVSPHHPLAALRTLALAHQFYFVDAIIQVKKHLGLHQYVKLVHKNPVPDEVLFLESTEHVVQRYDPAIVSLVAKLHGAAGMPKTARLLHTPASLVHTVSFHQCDVLFFAPDELGVARVPVNKTGPKAKRFGTTPALGFDQLELQPTVDDPLSTMAVTALQEHLLDRMPVVPALSAPASFDHLAALPVCGFYTSFLKFHQPQSECTVDLLRAVWKQLRVASTPAARIAVWRHTRRQYVACDASDQPPCPSDEFFVPIAVTADQTFCLLVLHVFG
jgi:hypothetical protein